MSWVVESHLTWFQQLCVNILKCGPIPYHMAFIMDGNRRFASKEHVDKTEGHIKGFDKLAECLQWCKEFGIKEVTVYAFSIENFKRSKEEVDTLMRLAVEKFQKLLDEKDKIMKEGLCIRIIGDLSLLSEELKKLIAEVILLTKDNNKGFLNVAFAYTSRNEMAHSVQTIVNGVKDGLVNINNINEDLISSCLYTNLSPNPEVVVRTSGEIRFSDFLLWQIGNSNVCFTNVLWPEFSIWHLIKCIFHYQRNYVSLKKYEIFQGDKQMTDDKVSQFLHLLEKARYSQLEAYIT